MASPTASTWRRAPPVRRWCCCLIVALQVLYSEPVSPTTDMSSLLPLVINTWPFTNATEKAWQVINSGGSRLDSVEAGCTVCEVEQCDGTVGYGGSPNEDGETTLDAMIMDGVTHDVGAVGCLRRVKEAISVARHVLQHTSHTLLVGDDAKNFAIEMGFKEVDLHTDHSRKMWQQWKKDSCQPNFWKNVVPDSKTHCGPYRPVHDQNYKQKTKAKFDESNHDTIGLITIDADGNIAAGTSTNGAKFKIPGRVGDSPIPGSGAYVDNNVGAAAATGDGDVMLRFLPSLQTVINMKLGMDPTAAAEAALKEITNKYPTFEGAIVAATKQGKYGAASHGFSTFKYSVVNPILKTVHVIPVQPKKL